MKICLSHTTALIWLMRHDDPRQDAAYPAPPDPADLVAPDRACTRRLLLALDLGVDELDILVARPAARRSHEGLRCHVLGRAALTAGIRPIMPIPSPLPDIELFVTAPELTLVQISQGATLQDAVYYGMALCSDYRLDPDRASGVRTREAGSRPLATLASLAAFNLAVPGYPGASMVRRALPHIRDHSRSPRETGLAMLFSLPPSLGGYALGEIAMNREVAVDSPVQRGREWELRSRYPDIVITARGRRGTTRRVGFDYDSDGEHAGSSRKQADDTRRRNDLAGVDALPCFALTTLQAADFNEVARVVEQMRRALGQRRTPRGRPGMTREERERMQAEADHRRFMLWKRFVARRKG